MFEKLLVANRGEIAVRIIRTAREMGIKTVAIYSELDRDALHVRLADEAYALGGQTVTESYLNTPTILDIISKAKVDALHPGYGFFSENSDFARSVTSSGVAFIGPPPEAIEIMGDKISSRIAAQKAGVEGVPGTVEVIQDPSDVISFGNHHGWPVAIKAAYGGVENAWVVAGIGLNCSQSRDELAGVGQGATSIFAESGIRLSEEGRVDLAQQLAAQFASLYISLGDSDRRIGLRGLYKSACDTIGKRVRVEMPGETLIGVASDISPEGNLLVETDSGTRAVPAGDVIHLRKGL